jgi:hypothetical protein
MEVCFGELQQDLQELVIEELTVMMLVVFQEQKVLISDTEMLMI